MPLAMPTPMLSQFCCNANCNSGPNATAILVQCHRNSGFYIHSILAPMLTQFWGNADSNSGSNSTAILGNANANFNSGAMPIAIMAPMPTAILAPMPISILAPILALMPTQF
jgi:hypothetical protein